MIRAGVIRNLSSHRNAQAGPSDTPEVLLTATPASPEHQGEALRRFAQEGVELVIVDGGDGTLREVITRLPEAYGGRWPKLAVLPNGKTNVLALDLGMKPGTPLSAVLDGRGPVKRRACLEVLREGGATQRGFVFGLGAFVRATRLARRSHQVGVFDGASVALTLGAAALQTLFGGGENTWRRGEAVRLAMGEETAEERARFLVLASTLKRLPLGLKPFGPPREGLKTLAIDAPPRRLAAALPILLSGRDAAWLAKAGYRREDVPMLSLSWSGEFVLDGEVYSGGALTVRQGPDLEFVTA